MFRVQSVQSTTSSASQASVECSRMESVGIQSSEIESLRVEPASPEPPAVQVAKWENGEFHCLLCNNMSQVICLILHLFIIYYLLYSYYLSLLFIE